LPIGNRPQRVALQATVKTACGFDGKASDLNTLSRKTCLSSFLRFPREKRKSPGRSVSFLSSPQELVLRCFSGSREDELRSSLVGIPAALREKGSRMSRFIFARRIIGPVVVLGLAGSARAVATANSVLAYNSGTNRFQFSAYTNSAVALGLPQTSTGGGFVVTPFNNPFSRNDVVSVGLGGEITLQLSNQVMPVGGNPEIGVFTFQQFHQGPGGGTDSGPSLFYPSIQAEVDVSENGATWVPLNNGNLISFDIPANAYQDTAHTIPSDYSLPFTGGLSALANEPSEASTLGAYNGSGGGTWLDISSTGLSEVDEIRFTVPSSDAFSFQLDAVTVNAAATGAAVPEPASGVVIGAIAMFSVRRRKRR
jgi:hypothetical protein